ncbi:hypothetical protein HGM15179_020962 [Zosterops borbonicus]|uniref:Uncharacterized protein n=1 Tax=Zosterops borbonicus TaxID=364589 RepID=A0A8K1FUJ0_9PASS|nr:hypothetical protein HGM15179_020962 [Zosterops borbonicus]
MEGMDSLGMPALPLLKSRSLPQPLFSQLRQLASQTEYSFKENEAHLMYFGDGKHESVTVSFTSLHHKPLSVDLTVENGQRLKVIYGSVVGFHAIDVDSGSVYDLYLPTHTLVFNPNENPLLLCKPLDHSAAPASHSLHVVRPVFVMDTVCKIGC